MSELLQEIQDSLVEGLTPMREPERFGGFLLLRDPSDRIPYLNQSIPVGECTVEDARELIIRYAELGLKPWFEFFPRIAPGVGEILESLGISRLYEMPIMVMHRSDWHPSPFSHKARLSEREDLAAGLEATAEAFGSPVNGNVESKALSIESGRLLSAVGFEGSQIVASGSAIGTERVREVAGIGTRPAWRRMGYGTAVVECLLERHFTSGGEIAWLTPGDDGAQSTYAKIGFQSIGVQATYGLPTGN